MTSARRAGRAGWVAFAAALGLAAGGLAGCGDEAATDGSTAAAAPITVPASEPSPDAEPTAEATAGGASPPATGEPELCADLDAVRDSVETMRGATVGEGAVAVVAEEVQALEGTLPDLRQAAAAQHATRVAEMETGAAAVRTSVEAAQADPSAATLLGVTTAVRALGATVDGLVQDVGDTC